MGRRAARRSARSGPCSGDAAAAAAGSAGRGADRDPGPRIRDRDLRRRAGRVTVRALTRQAGAAVRAGRGRRPRGRAEALGLWRGAPLADIPSQLLRNQGCRTWTSCRCRRWTRASTATCNGRHEQMVPELRDLTAASAARALHAQLMLALYRCGRQGGGTCRLPARARRPGHRTRGRARAGLQDLHQRILAADPALAGTRPAGCRAARRDHSRARRGSCRRRCRGSPAARPNWPR